MICWWMFESKDPTVEFLIYEFFRLEATDSLSLLQASVFFFELEFLL